MQRLPSAFKEEMEDVQNAGVEQEIAQMESAPPQTEAKHDEVPAESAAPPEEKGWISKLRRDRDEAVRKSRMQEDLIAKLMTQQPAQSMPAPIEPDVLDDISQQEFVEGKKVAKAIQGMKEDFNRKLQEIEKKSAVQQMNSRFSQLQQKYPDLTEVVNRDTLEILAQNDPHIGSVLDGKSDYEIYVLAYPLIKNSGILNELEGHQKSKEVDKKLAQNKKTVPSPQSFDKRPMAQAFQYEKLSKEQKLDLQREMYGFAAQAGGVQPMIG